MRCHERVDKMQAKAHEKKRIQANIDKELAEQAEQIFSDIGLTTTSALTAFYKQVVANDGMPFELTRITAKEKLDRVVQQEIADGKFKKVSSREELSRLLVGDDEEE
ncbi:type II toxin-antitoxin system RelB/DinJ family antitoxin [Levilactobacillus parabrevis]|nr:type II toxin-antitoxin system RelB/DinJ family antitoxin [Levilactobacillus parabrevis]MCT4490786.1 type II toxin-antitoxin system RelB/DinJ family antitoxin [Levilactobacillus parabrevis]